MRVFIGFGYNDRDRWIPELVFPLVGAFGCEVVTGEDMQGQQITEGVRRRIDGSDGLIAFRTRRGDPDAGGVFRTHRWVEDELAYAIGRDLNVLEVHEQGVDEQGGMANDRQRIAYEEGERDHLLVDLAKTIGAWMRTVTVNLQLLPPAFVDEIRPLLRAPGFSCTYTLLEGSRESGARPAEIRPIKGGLFLRVPELSSDALIQICVEGNGRRWTSDYETLDSVAIALHAG